MDLPGQIRQGGFAFMGRIHKAMWGLYGFGISQTYQLIYLFFFLNTNSLDKT